MPADFPRPNPHPIKRGRAVQLLEALIAAGEMTEDTFAHALGVQLTTLRRYLECSETMPLNRQARLALYVIANSRRFVREGNQLRGQVAAAIAFESRRMQGVVYKEIRR